MTQNATIYYGGFAFRGGGVFIHAQLLCSELKRAGWGVELITLESLPLPLRFLPHIVGKVVNTFNPPLGFYYKDRLTRLLYKLLFDRDVQLRIFEDIYLGWNSRIPSVSFIHAVWSDNLQSISTTPAAVQRLVELEERAIDSIAHPITTVSGEYRESLKKSHGGSTRLPGVVVIPLGLDLALFDSAGPAQPSPKSLIFCGSLETRKNLRFLLRVFRQLHQVDSDYRLTIVGDGPDRADLERYAVQHELPVVFRGWLGREEIIKELRLHRLYIHPSVKESFSFALLEAKLAGLKTVAYEGLEVPAEFVDVPVPSFDEADWLKAIRGADKAVSRDVNADKYSSLRMMHDTLKLASGDATGLK